MPVSACQRSGVVKAPPGAGRVSALAPYGRCRSPSARAHPAGAGGRLAVGSGAGSIPATATSPAAVTATRAVSGPRRAQASWSAKASSAAAHPSAVTENRSGMTETATGSSCSQYQGSLIDECTWPAYWSVPPREKTSRTTNAAASTRTGSTRHRATDAQARTASIGQPR